jgi:parvulin-like peptidyl-prolyl isomerase
MIFKIPLSSLLFTFWALFLPQVLLAEPPVSEKTETHEVVATYQGEKLTKAEIDKIIEANPSFAYLKKQNPQNIDSLRREVAARVIDRALLLDYAEKSKKIAHSEVQQGVEKIIKGYGGKDSLKDLLKSMNTSLEDFLKDITADLKISSFVTHGIFPLVKVSDDDVKNVYEKDPKAYSAPEKVEARHILLAVEKGANPESVESALQKILVIQKELSKHPKLFAETAKQFSDDPSAANGGTLGTFARGRMLPEVEEVAFKLKVGDISEPVRSSLGFHILQVTARHESVPTTFDKASEQIRKEIERAQSDKLVEKLLGRLRTDAQVKISN